jgi:hypothetical protein
LFSIIALEPNPAAGRPDVTHPHVIEKRLCAGDAVNPIRTALESGRLATENGERLKHFGDVRTAVKLFLRWLNPYSATCPVRSGWRCLANGPGQSRLYARMVTQSSPNWKLPESKLLSSNLLLLKSVILSPRLMMNQSAPELPVSWS